MKSLIYKENIGTSDVKSVVFEMGIWIMSSITAFFLPIIPAIVFVILLVFADTITGVMKAGLVDVADIKSKKAFKLIPKLIIYLIFIILAGSASKFIDVPFVTLALLGVSWIEIKSIDENFKEIFGISFIDKIFEALRKIKNYERKNDQ